MSKNLKFPIVILLLVSILFTSIHASAAPQFNDVKSSDWFNTAVNYALETGKMNGTSTNTFSPYGKVTRATLAQMIYNWRGKPSFETSKYRIKDVNSGDWYYASAYWLSGNGIMNCYGDLTFRPNEYLTREDVALAIKRYSRMCEVDEPYDDTKLRTFSDYKSVSNWAEDSMKWMTSLGIYNGDDKGNVRPQDTLTRAELAQMLYNLKPYFN